VHNQSVYPRGALAAVVALKTMVADREGRSLDE